MKKKGFTLIELLAVIVILAIIALIAVPIVLNIIEDTKNSATLRSADFYLEAVELSIAKSILDGGKINGEYEVKENGKICNVELESLCINVEVSGDVPDLGSTIIITNGQIDAVSLKYDNKTVIKDGKSLVLENSSSDGGNNNNNDDDYNDDDNDNDLPDDYEPTLSDEEILAIAEVYKNKVEEFSQSIYWGSTVSCYVNPDGNLDCDGYDFEVELEGVRPTSGRAYYNGRKVSLEKVVIDGREVSTQNNDLHIVSYSVEYIGIEGSEDYATTIKSGSTLKIDLTNKIDDISKIKVLQKNNSGYEVITEYTYKNNILTIPNVKTDTKIINFNKTCVATNEKNYEPGTHYTCLVNNNSAYGFYLLSTNNASNEIINDKSSDKTISSVNLILDTSVSWEYGEQNCNNRCMVYWAGTPSEDYYYYDDELYSYNDQGPTLAMHYTHILTSSWDNVDKIIMNYQDELTGDYGYGGIATNKQTFVTTITKKDGTATATFENLKARLPMYHELEYLGCTTTWMSCPSWLKNISTHMGFWTLASNPLNQDSIYYVDGAFSATYFTTNKNIIPVITVSVDDLGE